MSLELGELKLLTDRFDKVDLDNKDIKEKVDAIRIKVDRHSIYWNIVKYGLVPIGATLAGWLGFDNHIRK
jgi:hypothetical protein